MVNFNCGKCFFFSFVKEFPNGKLPLYIDVSSFILSEGKLNQGKSIEWQDIAVDLVLHWVFFSLCIRSK